MIFSNNMQYSPFRFFIPIALSCDILKKRMLIIDKATFDIDRSELEYRTGNKLILSLID